MAYPGAPMIMSLANAQGGNIPDIPDLPDASGNAQQSGSEGGKGIVDFTGLVKSVQSTSPALERAQKADANFVNGKGNLMEMMLQRKIADTYLQIDEAFSSKAVQAITTIMNMQV